MLEFIYRKFLYTLTRFPGRKIRVFALRKLGFEVGESVYIGPRLTISSGIMDKNMKLKIGDRVSFGPNVSLILASNPNNSKIKKIIKLPPRIIEIGEDTWLGANSIIMPNVRIGEKVIVGAGAVVTKDIPSYSVVGGVPAKIIKTLEKELFE